jgi:hypothetical protein
MKDYYATDVINDEIQMTNDEIMSKLKGRMNRDRFPTLIILSCFVI